MTTNYGYENLVIKGGGNTIFPVFGALEILEKHGILKNIKKMAGSSAGAGIISLLAIGYTPKEMSKIFSELDVSKFLDGSLGYLGYIYRLYNYSGIFHGDDMYKWFGSIIAEKTGGDPDITFKEVYDKFGVDLVITGTCVNKRETHYYRRVSNPNMPIRSAVSISTRIPLVFKPIRWKGDWLTDGGLSNNYPIWIFDKETYNSKEGKVVRDRTVKLNPKTLGLSVLSQNEEETDSIFHGNDEINGNVDYFVAILSTLLTQQQRMDIDTEFWPQTISIPSNGNMKQVINFKTSKEDKLSMIREGRVSSSKFLSNRRKLIRLAEIYRLAEMI